MKPSSIQSYKEFLKILAYTVSLGPKSLIMQTAYMLTLPSPNIEMTLDPSRDQLKFRAF